VKYSSFKKQQTLFENWRRYLKEAADADSVWDPTDEWKSGRTKDYDAPIDPYLEENPGSFPQGKESKYTLTVDGDETYPWIHKSNHGIISHGLKHYGNFPPLKVKIEQIVENVIKLIQDWIDDWKKTDEEPTPRKVLVFDNTTKAIKASKEDKGNPDAAIDSNLLANAKTVWVINMIDMIHDKKQNKEEIKPHYKALYNDIWIKAQEIGTEYVRYLKDLRDDPQNTLEINGQQNKEEIAKAICSNKAILFKGTRDGLTSYFIFKYFNKQGGAYVALTERDKLIVTGFLSTELGGTLSEITPEDDTLHEIFEEYLTKSNKQEGRSGAGAYSTRTKTSLCNSLGEDEGEATSNIQVDDISLGPAFQEISLFLKNWGNLFFSTWELSSQLGEARKTEAAAREKHLTNLPKSGRRRTQAQEAYQKAAGEALAVIEEYKNNLTVLETQLKTTNERYAKDVKNNKYEEDQGEALSLFFEKEGFIARAQSDFGKSNLEAHKTKWTGEIEELSGYGPQAQQPLSESRKRKGLRVIIRRAPNKVRFR